MKKQAYTVNYSDNLLENKPFLEGVKYGLLLGILLTVLILVVSNVLPIINGFLVKENFHEQTVNITASEPGSYTLALEKHPASFKLDSFTISGRITGDKLARVYLENDEGEKLLVLDSLPNSITGMAIAEENGTLMLIETNETNKVKPDRAFREIL